jgi:ACS family hexuronate transporter-like MFS transporter
LNTASSHQQADVTPRRAVSPIRGLRWWIGGLLFAMTVINYIDKQTLSVLAPILKKEHGWTNTDFAIMLISFRVAYTIMQSPSGWFLDRAGTRRGLSVAVAFYSIVAALTAAARGLTSFSVFRFLLGSGEAANNPGAAKAVSEWFPDRERAWAVAMFDSGSSVGGAVAPFLVLFIYRMFGSWRPAFVLTASLGAIWLVVWIKLYRLPQEHPRITAEELHYIQRGQSSASAPVNSGLPPVSWVKLLRYRQTWGIVLGRFLLDPYWFLVADWFAVYLVSKGFRMEQSALGFWAPFLAADLGNFFAGGLSSFWIRRGWPVGRARRTVLLIFGPSMLLLIPAAFASSFIVLILLFAWASFAYAACSTIFLSLPTDVFHTRVVGSVSGLGGTGAGIGTLISTYLIGRIADQFSFQPIVIAASLVPCLATVVFVSLVRAGRHADPEGIMLQF